MDFKRLAAETQQDQRDSFIDSLELATRINRELLDGAFQDRSTPADWFLSAGDDCRKFFEAA